MKTRVLLFIAVSLLMVSCKLGTKQEIVGGKWCDFTGTYAFNNDNTGYYDDCVPENKSLLKWELNDDSLIFTIMNSLHAYKKTRRYHIDSIVSRRLDTGEQCDEMHLSYQDKRENSGTEVCHISWIRKKNK